MPNKARSRTTWPAATAARASWTSCTPRLRSSGHAPDVQVPDSLRALVTHTGRGRGEALTAQLPSLYALANAFDANAADDLVQETLTSALADPDTEAPGSGLAATLTRLATERRPELESPAVPTVGSDPDADEPEPFYPGFYTDGLDAGAWVDPPVAWGEAHRRSDRGPERPTPTDRAGRWATR